MVAMGSLVAHQLPEVFGVALQAAAKTGAATRDLEEIFSIKIA